MAVISGLQGKALVGYLCNLLKTLPVTGLQKSDYACPENGIRLYEKLGYKKTGNEFLKLPSSLCNGEEFIT